MVEPETGSESNRRKGVSVEKGEVSGVQRVHGLLIGVDAPTAA